MVLWELVETEVKIPKLKVTKVEGRIIFKLLNKKPNQNNLSLSNDTQNR